MSNYNDFTGFTFNGKHSSDMGIIRVSDGSRYNEDLLPTLQDKTIQVPGGDGAYYFGSYYTQRTFPVQFAFDNLSELQFRNLRAWISTRTPGRLVFDERPYKYYTAKISQTNSTIKHICFDDENGERVYKGEGTLNFICYNPFAKSVHKYLNSYYSYISDSEKTPAAGYENIDQWKGSTGMLEEKGSYDTAILSSDNKTFTYQLYNPGDFEADFYLELRSTSFSSDNKALSDMKIVFKLNNEIKSVLSWSAGDTIPRNLVINSKNNSIYDQTKESELYTGILTEGDFFKIPIGESTLEITIETEGAFSTGASSDIVYDYLYI